MNTIFQKLVRICTDDRVHRLQNFLETHKETINPLILFEAINPGDDDSYDGYQKTLFAIASPAMLRILINFFFETLFPETLRESDEYIYARWRLRNALNARESLSSTASVQTLSLGYMNRYTNKAGSFKMADAALNSILKDDLIQIWQDALKELSYEQAKIWKDDLKELSYVEANALMYSKEIKNPTNAMMHLCLEIADFFNFLNPLFRKYCLKGPLDCLTGLLILVDEMHYIKMDLNMLFVNNNEAFLQAASAPSTEPLSQLLAYLDLTKVSQSDYHDETIGMLECLIQASIIPDTKITPVVANFCQLLLEDYKNRPYTDYTPTLSETDKNDEDDEDKKDELNELPPSSPSKRLQTFRLFDTARKIEQISTSGNGHDSPAVFPRSI